MKFYSVNVSNKLDSKEEPFQFLKAQKAPEIKRTKIDFFFKKDPRLHSLNGSESRRAD